MRSDVTTSPQVINITGTGTYPLTLFTCMPLSFSAQTVGTSSPQGLHADQSRDPSETFTLSTTGDFTASSNCGHGCDCRQSSCLVYVTFTPSSVLPFYNAQRLADVADTRARRSRCRLCGRSPVRQSPPILPAAVSVVSPGAGAAGTTMNAVITGNGWTHFNASSVITFVDTDDPINNPSDITATVPDTTTTTLNTIHAQLVITANPGVVYGARNVSVVTTLPGGRNGDGAA
jgi:hypothetical protein